MGRLVHSSIVMVISSLLLVIIAITKGLLTCHCQMIKAVCFRMMVALYFALTYID